MSPHLHGWYFESNHQSVYCGSPAVCVVPDSCARCHEEDRQVNNWTERGTGPLPQGTGPETGPIPPNTLEPPLVRVWVPGAVG